MGFVVLFLIPSAIGALVYVAGRALLARLGPRRGVPGLIALAVVAAVAFLRLRDPGLSLMRDGDLILLLALLAGLCTGALGALVQVRLPHWLGLSLAILPPILMWF
jgi:hypothetical protein